MYSAITGFILGIAGLQQQAALPGKTVLLILSSLAVAFLVLSFVPVLKQRFEPAVMLARALAECVLCPFRHRLGIRSRVRHPV